MMTVERVPFCIKNNQTIKEEVIMAVERNHPYDVLLGDLYARWTLDSLIEIAHSVSRDYVARPDFYRGGDVPDKIVDLEISYGYLRNYPNKDQRSTLITPILGTSDEQASAKTASDQFHQLRAPLFKACIAYEESTAVDAPKGLKQGIIDAMNIFPTFLKSFDGHSLRSSHKQIEALSNLAYEILKSSTVSGVFGVPSGLPHDWPLAVDSPYGAQLVYQISQQLQLGDSGMNKQEESLLIAIAHEGNKALQAILIPNATDDNHIDDLVSKVYSWAKALEHYYGVLSTPTAA